MYLVGMYIYCKKMIHGPSDVILPQCYGDDWMFDCFALTSPSTGLHWSSTCKEKITLFIDWQRTRVREEVLFWYLDLWSKSTMKFPVLRMEQPLMLRICGMYSAFPTRTKLLFFFFLPSFSCKMYTSIKSRCSWKCESPSTLSLKIQVFWNVIF